MSAGRSPTGATAARDAGSSPLRIGLTGGIASGKSAAAEFFRDLGAHIVDADVVARELVQPGEPALDAIVSTFGHGFLDPTGGLDRRKMRDHVFASDVARKSLEGILHPRIQATLQRQAAAASTAYVLVAVPLLAEAGSYPWLHRVLVIDVDEETQIRRVQQRDVINRKQALAALRAQASRIDRLRIGDDVVINDAGWEPFKASIVRLHYRYARDAGEAAGQP